MAESESLNPIVTQVRRARAVGVPLVAIQTADQIALVKSLVAGINGKSPIVLWDQLSGLSAGNDLGETALTALIGPNDPTMFRSLPEVLLAAKDLPERSALVIQNAHQFIDAGPVIQGAMNVRDIYKNTRRTLVLVGTQFKLPAELSQDVIVLTEALPEPAEITAIVGKLFADTKTACDEKDLARVTDALRGLPAFAVEQAAALAITRDHTVDVADCWERKRTMIDQVRGLRLENPSESCDQVGGLAQAKKFFQAFFAGPRKPSLIVFLDEIEKSMGGSGASGQPGDSSGVAQDAHGVLLKETEGKAAALFLGPPGSGKTMFPRALAKTYGVPLITLDLGALKGSLVGQSEQSIRLAFETIRAMAGDNPLYIGTCNRLDSLSTELRRRFSKLGLWFFDLPDQDERRAIGAIQTSRAQFPVRTPDEAPFEFFGNADGWSGANIRDCCELAAALDCSLDDAAAYVVPAAIADPEGLARLRALAAGRFLSASYPGTYRQPVKAAVPQTRRIEMED